MKDRYCYLDNAAAAPLDPRVLSVMEPYLRDHYANPSSVHAEGRRARIAVEQAREYVAALIGADTSEIVFTSGGTESNNTAVSIAVSMIRHESTARIVTTPAEHQAILGPCSVARIQQQMLRVNAIATPDPEELRDAIRDKACFVTLMHVNNETGGILDIDSAASVSKEYGAVFHSDLAQSAGKLPLNVKSLPLDLASLSAHKLHGPKGIGALYVRKGMEMTSFISGGAQERGRRGGTEHVSGIVGFGEAARIALLEMQQRFETWKKLRETLLRHVRDAFDSLRVNSDEDACLPNIISISFPSSSYPMQGELLPLNLDLRGCAVSGGSACTAGSTEASHVMRAIGHDDATARATVRISFGAFTSMEDVVRGASALVETVQEMVEDSSDRSHSRIAIP